MTKIVLVILYALCYQIVHVYYLYEMFGYMGYMSYDVSIGEMLMTLLFVLLPLLVKPKEHGALDVCFTFFYLLLYVPIIVTMVNQYEHIAEVFYNQIFFVIGFLIIFFIPNVSIVKIRGVGIGEPGRKAILYICLAVTLFLLYNFRSSFSFVSFDSVYEHRSAVEYSSWYVGYLVLWNTYFLGPLLLVQGILNKKKIYVVVGMLSVIATYGMTSSKIALFIPAGTVSSYFLMAKGKSIFKFFSLGLSCLMLLLLSISEKFFMLSAVILMRTFGISGLLTYQYNEFFKNSPKTYLSHVNIVNFFTHWYPYDDILGVVVSKYFDPTSETNANANFWATDGIAGFGLFGVILISIILGLYLALIKSIEDKSNKVLVGMMMTPFCFIVLNVSLFTAILSGGFLFIIFYYLVFRKNSSEV